MGAEIEDLSCADDSFGSRLIATRRSSRVEADGLQRHDTLGGDIDQSFDLVEKLPEDFLQSGTHGGSRFAGPHDQDAASVGRFLMQRQMGIIEGSSQEVLRSGGRDCGLPDLVGVLAQRGG
jgi:hypothetical protein